MTRMMNPFFLAGTLALMMIVSCSDDANEPAPPPNPNPNPNPVGGDVTISSIPDGVFWQEELTITGTGFSTVKEENIVKFTNVSPPTVVGCNLNYTSAAGGDIEIVSASATQLKIKVPVKLAHNVIENIEVPSCGPRSADIEVTVKDKKASFTGVDFRPLPTISGFLYHYGWFDYPKLTRIGDSVMIGGGLLATPPNSSKYWDDIRLSINGANMPIKFRTIGLESGWAFYLSADQFGEMNCSEEPDGMAAREMEFKFFLEGTDKSASRMLYVQYLPSMIASCKECPSPLNKAAGGNPEWVVTGQNMYYTEVRFSPVSPCTGATQGMAITSDPWTEEIRFEIPLSILTENCGYGVFLANECGVKYIGQVGLE